VNRPSSLPIRAFLLRLAGRLVPKPQREEWNSEHTGRLWEWTLRAAAAGTPDSQFALDQHVKRAWQDALRLRFSRELFGGPQFCLGLSTAILTALAILSGGLPELRHMIYRLPYRDPDRVVILAQGPPYFGMRLGFRDREALAFQEHAPALEGVATYTWSPTVFAASGRKPRHREIIAAEVSPDFFNVLGVGTILGTSLHETPPESAIKSELAKPESGVKPEAGIKNEDLESFLISDDFWRKELGARNNVIGQHFEIGGRSLRLAGVLPRGFTFLSTPIAVWTLAPPELPVPRRWWMGLKGAVGRLRPGAAPYLAESQMQQALKDAHIARRNFQVKATPIGDLAYRAAWSYGIDFAACLGVFIIWAVFNILRDRRRGASWEVTRGFWGFFVLKTLIPVAAFFVLVLEFSGATRLGVTGGIPPGQGPLGVWFHYSGLALLLMWAWRDQPQRCRVCLQRMQNPIRIGIPGQVLLETAGEEVMCPYGHGSVFTSESVLGADISDRWMGFP
jgi:hypothetical protein